MTKYVSNDAAAALEHSQMILEPLILWLIRAGIGHNDFASALKPLFLKQAMAELHRLDTKPTNTAISLLSGLHRQDVKALKEVLDNPEQRKVPKINSHVSVPARVVGHWIAEQWPETIPFSGDEHSFESLVSHVSNDLYPRAILNELSRLGVVSDQQDMVQLKQQAFIPDTLMQETQAIFAANMADHLMVGVHNLMPSNADKYLEQAVYADELTPQSIQQLQQFSAQLWKNAAEQILQQAIKYCAQDEGHPDATYRFRFGAYQFDQIQESEATADAQYATENKP
jgi:hypothetical protein